MCFTTPLDEGAVAKIAALGAEFRQVSKSPFGTDDEIGMMNLVTPESMGSVLGSLDAGKVFDLSVDFFPGMPSWTAAGDPPFQIWMTHTPTGTIREDPMGFGREQNELVGYSGDVILMYTHCGTHIDTLNHFGYRGEIWNGFNEREHLGARHWRVAGADRQPPVIARGVLIDVAALHGVDCLPDSYGIGAKDLTDALARQKTELRPGDVAIVRTGRMRAWPDFEAYVLNEPGLNREGAELLCKAGAIMVGADNLGVEQAPSADPENWQVVHTYLLAEAGVSLLEVANMEELSAEGLYEFAFIGACLRIRGATGSPMRPLAIPLRS